MGKIRKEYNMAFDIVSASKYHPGNYVDFWVGLELCQKYGMAELEERLIGLQPASEEAALQARQTPKPIEVIFSHRLLAKGATLSEPESAMIDISR